MLVYDWSAATTLIILSATFCHLLWSHAGHTIWSIPNWEELRCGTFVRCAVLLASVWVPYSL